jgi:aspartate/methionine/tyrosine aminotransferase
MITPAQRISSVQEYYFSRKLKEVAQMNAEGKDIISLAIGSPDLPPSPKTIETLCTEARKPTTHGYQPTSGIPELKAAMANYYQRRYGVTLNPQTEIQPLIGSKEGILHTTLAFVNPGEKVLVPNPGYPTYTSLSRLLGCEVIYYDLLPENNWQPDFEALEAMDLSDVKIMWTNYPHMPTGAVALQETYEKMVDFGRKHHILIVNDNPYSTILNKNPKSILQVPGAMACCIEFNSMSKSHNMPGWRIGMLVAQEQYIKYILQVKSNIDSGTFRAMQLAAVAAYDNDEAWHEEHNYRVYASRRNIAEQVMETLGCQYDKKQVGMFLWGRIPDHFDTAETLTERILHETRVFIAPGFIFGSNGNRYIRISLCANEEKIQEALLRIKRWTTS